MPAFGDTGQVLPHARLIAVALPPKATRKHRSLYLLAGYRRS